MERVFFGYSAKPAGLRQTLADVATRVRALRSVASSVSWEDLRVDGRLIVNEVEQAIKDCSLAVFDLTTMNDNVLFELGLAIGQQKRVAILRQKDDAEAVRKWVQFALLTTTGWTGYSDADHLFAEVARLVSSGGKPLWEDLMQGVSASVDESQLLYFPSAKTDKASQRFSRLIERYGKFNVQSISFDDYGTMPLEWYAELIYRSRIAVFHLTPSTGYLADTINPRMSLLAGMVRGLDRDVLIVVEDHEETAIDYRDIAIRYSSVSQLEKLGNAWLADLRDPNEPTGRKYRRNLTTELASLRFGSHVAEQDQEGLDTYFVETSDFRDILNSYVAIFTGRKGTGKTANMLQAAEALQQDPRNLVCVIRPASYEIEGLLDVLRRISRKHLDDYLIDALWRYLIYTEIASRAVEEAELRPAGIAAGSEMDLLRKCLEAKHLGVAGSFSLRLEGLVDSLSTLLVEELSTGSIGDARGQINAALYGGTLKELRSLLGNALSGRNRVAVLIDNLDKAWERGADLDLLAQLVLGLLGSIGRVVDEFHRENSLKARVNVSLTVFLRSDIYSFVRDRASEPDKIKVVEIEWRDKNLLARVLEDRFLAERKDGTAATDLWTQYFAENMRGVPSRDYILSRVQARPRDLVFLANSAVSHATNAKHRRIEETDLVDAEKAYSQFAYEALLVEGLASSPNLDEVLLEFAGEESVLEASRVTDLLVAAGCTEDDHESVVAVLRQLGFIGLETTDTNFDYGGTGGEIRRADVLAKKHQKATGLAARYEVHPAYRAYLEIKE